MPDRRPAGSCDFCLVCSCTKTVHGEMARCFGSVKSAVFLSSLFSRIACLSGVNGFRLRVAGFGLTAAFDLVVLDLVDLACFLAGFLVAVRFFVAVDVFVDAFVDAFADAFGRPGVAKLRTKA